MNAHDPQALSAYADGELPPAEASRMEAHLEGCTECLRELSNIRTMGEAMRRELDGRASGGIWEGVHRRITRPLGWGLLVIGAAVWAGLLLVSWFRQTLSLEWAALTTVGVGLAMLTAGIAYEQYREWKDSPYKDIER
jgi:anti-sigma factor RsiW